MLLVALGNYVLKFATRAKFLLKTTHMTEMIIALDSSFREVQFWYKDHLILTRRNGILNLFSLMHKLSRSTSVKYRLKSPIDVSSLSTKCINRSDLSPHLDITHLIPYLSFTSLEIFWSLTAPFNTLSLMKWYLISMCFDLSWNTGFSDSLIQL